MSTHDGPWPSQGKAVSNQAGGPGAATCTPGLDKDQLPVLFPISLFGSESCWFLPSKLAGPKPWGVLAPKHCCSPGVCTPHLPFLTHSHSFTTGPLPHRYLKKKKKTHRLISTDFLKKPLSQEKASQKTQKNERHAASRLLTRSGSGFLLPGKASHTGSVSHEMAFLQRTCEPSTGKATVPPRPRSHSSLAREGLLWGGPARPPRKVDHEQMEFLMLQHFSSRPGFDSVRNLSFPTRGTGTRDPSGIRAAPPRPGGQPRGGRRACPKLQIRKR